MKFMRRANPLIVVLALTLATLCEFAVSQTSHANYGILRSTDSGKNWKQVFRNDFDTDHLVIDKDGHILACTMIVTSNRMFSELYASSLGGDTWKRVVLPGATSKNDLIFDLLATPDGSVLVLLKGRILRTGDGGLTWTVMASTLPADLSSLKLGPNHSLLGFSKDGLYQSLDDGASWHSLGFEGQMLNGGITLSDGTILVTFQCKLFATSLSQDGSSEWLLPEDDCPNSSQLASDARGNLFANTPHGILKSDLTGKIWHKVLPFEDRVMPFGIAVAPDSDVYAVILKGISSPTLFHSKDEGTTWQAVQKLGPGVTVSQFAFASNGTVYVGLNSFGD
jgi:photosystem II stability/assembly factor-like uncharacterized protein